MRRLGFTMIELIFVIVVMGIIGKFGTEFLAQAYRSFIFSSVNNTLQAQSEMAVETIAARLQFRIKDSIIGRRSDTNAFLPPASIPTADSQDYDILEWVGSDIEGFRGDSLPHWSGIIDLDNSSAILLDSPGTNTTNLNAQIAILSNGGSGINNAALYFIGADSDINNYGWAFGGGAFIDQSNVMHPINSVAGQPDQFAPSVDDFSGIDVFEYYQLAWTAYAVGFDDDYDRGGTDTGTLWLWYDYQPWEGETYKDDDTKKVALMNNVSTFRYKAVGSIMKIQVCTKSLLLTNEEYSLCKEKTIF